MIGINPGDVVVLLHSIKTENDTPWLPKETVGRLVEQVVAGLWIVRLDSRDGEFLHTLERFVDFELADVYWRKKYENLRETVFDIEREAVDMVGLSDAFHNLLDNLRGIRK